MIDIKVYNNWLKSDLSYHSSWAIWSGVGNDSADLLRDPSSAPISQLNPDIVMLSMNKAGHGGHVFTEDDRCMNFHWLKASRHDRRLRLLCDRVPSLKGAYMTDVDKETFESDSSKLQWDATDKKDFAQQLRSELHLIGSGDNPTIIAFGGAVQEFLDKYMPDLTQVIPVYHYAYNRLSSKGNFANDEIWLTYTENRIKESGLI